MDFKSEEWLVPHKVETPDIEDDIRNYLGVEVLDRWKVSKDTETKKTIVFIAERLDFISHLNVFKKHAINNSEEIYLKNSDELRVRYYFEMDGHDLSGVQFDIEALVLYLLMTCIDAIQSQPKYYSAFEFLQNNVEKFEHRTKAQLEELLKSEQTQYEELYGLSKNFRLAFTDGISEVLRHQIAENIIVAKFDDNGINKESFVAWKAKDVNGKIKKIANYLYHLRSKYTHNNIRSFLPEIPLGTRKLKGEFLLCKTDFHLDEKLLAVIKELCFNKLR